MRIGNNMDAKIHIHQGCQKETGIEGYGESGTTSVLEDIYRYRSREAKPHISHNLFMSKVFVNYPNLLNCETKLSHTSFQFI